MTKLSAAQAAALDSERQLKTSSRFFEQILAGLTTGVMVFDKDCASKLSMAYGFS